MRWRGAWATCASWRRPARLWAPPEIQLQTWGSAALWRTLRSRGLTGGWVRCLCRVQRSLLTCLGTLPTSTRSVRSIRRGAACAGANGMFRWRRAGTGAKRGQRDPLLSLYTTHILAQVTVVRKVCPHGRAWRAYRSVIEVCGASTNGPRPSSQPCFRSPAVHFSSIPLRLHTQRRYPPIIARAPPRRSVAWTVAPGTSSGTWNGTSCGLPAGSAPSPVST
jgi:hypothetical protein